MILNCILSVKLLSIALNRLNINNHTHSNSFYPQPFVFTIDVFRIFFQFFLLYYTVKRVHFHCRVTKYSRLLERSFLNICVGK